MANILKANQEKCKDGMEESKEHSNVMKKVLYQLRFLLIT